MHKDHAGQRPADEEPIRAANPVSGSHLPRTPEDPPQRRARPAATNGETGNEHEAHAQDDSIHCRRCGHELHAERSVARGIGPVCVHIEQREHVAHVAAVGLR